MKKLLFLLLYLLIHSICQAQDTIIVDGGQIIIGKVTKISENEIEYNEATTPDINSYIAKMRVKMIHYQNGVSDNFTGEDLTLQQQGIADAHKYYKGYKQAMIFSAISVVYLGYGFITPIACYATRPHNERLNYPYPELMEYPEYKSAYVNTAYKIKKHKVLAGSGIGIGIIMSVAGAVLIALSYH